MKTKIGSISAVALVLLTLSHSVQANQRDSDPGAYRSLLKAGKPMSGPLDLNAMLGVDYATYRFPGQDVLSCQYNAGPFLLSNDDPLVVGVPDRAAGQRSATNIPFMWNEGMACGQCYLFRHLGTGNAAVAVGADNCLDCANKHQGGAGGSFDLSPGLKAKLLGLPVDTPHFEDNVYHQDLEVTPVACDWGRPMRYVVLPGSHAHQWYLQIQGHNVPIREVTAAWQDKRGRWQAAQAKNELGFGRWSIAFPGTGNPGRPGNPITLIMKSDYAPEVRDTLTLPENFSFLPTSYSSRDMLPNVPAFTGSAQFTPNF